MKVLSRMNATTAAMTPAAEGIYRGAAFAQMGRAVVMK
jgi:hypothetical protein